MPSLGILGRVTNSLCPTETALGRYSLHAKPLSLSPGVLPCRLADKSNLQDRTVRVKSLDQDRFLSLPRTYVCVRALSPYPRST